MAVLRARLPEWMRHTARLRPVPVDRALVARGAVGMLVPLAIGQFAGRPDLGAAAALGAYGAAVDDTAAPWRTRALTLVLPQFAGAIGLALGRLTGGVAWAQILLVAVVALASGLVSTIGRISDMATLVLLLATAMGLGLPTGPPWWQVPGLFLLGGLPLMLLSLADALRRPGRAERLAVAEAVRAVGGLLGATGDTWTERRHALTAVMDAAYDTVLVRRLSAPRPGSTAARLTGHLDRLIEVIAAAPAVRTPGAEPPVGYADAVHRIADAIEAGGAPPPIPLPPAAAGDPHLRALRTAVTALAASLGEATGEAIRHVPPRPVPSRRLAGALADRLRDPAARRYALRLALCLGAAQVVASYSGLPRSGWLVLTVALVVRPGLGTVPARLLLRGVGTIAGVLVGLAAITVLPAGWWRIAATVVLTGLLQAYARRNYALQTFFLTPVMLLLADPLGQAGSAVPEARLLDTVIGCALAFVVGYLLWPEDTRARVPHRLASAHDSIAAYADALEGPGDITALHTLRRRIHADLAAVHTELARLRTDPRHRHTLQDWQDDLAYAEAAIARLTTQAAAGHHDGHKVPEAATRDLSAHLRRRAAHLREHGAFRK
ncbi:FUSC family protein [Streptomyces sp. NBC_01304]|uniref:FUSC family protein n=1 Tax=Streptomyces sp. NBC_01304 TaxID=2903818 RepID=UPI002E1531E7|nr:FUSC family protein [Streptomyces sp. NBC_01304]